MISDSKKIAHQEKPAWSSAYRPSYPADVEESYEDRITKEMGIRDEFYDP